MLSLTDLAARPDYTVASVTCTDDHKRWSEVESHGDYRIVLVRRGRFQRRSAGGSVDIDPTLAYVAAPADEEHFAHPAGGDVCTLVSLTPALWSTLAGEASRPFKSTVYIDPRLDLTHRRFLATAAGATAAGGDVDFALAEELLALLRHVVEQVATGPTPASGRPASADRAIVTAAREAINDGGPAADGLFPLAEYLGVSPYRLSRAFTRELGVSLTRYRNRVRLGRALDRLERGEPSLATLAADLGFADQAHLSRTMNEHLGHTPTAVRRLLAAPTP